jgi:O-antigen biosynthesis protein
MRSSVPAGPRRTAGLRSRIVSEALKYTRFNEEAGSAHMLALELVPQGSRVLEFGCATGYMSEVLRERRGATVTGIEISPQAGEIAKEHCDRVIIGDAETLDYEELFGKGRFDVMLFVDVLEHLKDPAALLRRVRPFLSRKGMVISSIPNIAHGSVRLALLAGEFRYRELGLLDDTHLRFFTREGIRDLLEGAGFVITDWLHHRVDIDEAEIRVPAIPQSQELRDWLSEDPDTSVYQFVVRALPSTAANQLADLRRRLTVASEQLLEMEHLRRAVTELHATVAQLAESASQETIARQGEVIEALRGREQDAIDRERATRELLLAANRDLLLRDQELRRIDAERRSEATVYEAQIARLHEHIAEIQRALAETQGTLETLHATKAWQAVGTFWRTRDSISRALRVKRT